jgi:hypothetical protein
MVKLYEDTNIKAIADAIRAKNGTEETYKTSEMASAIEAITSGSKLVFGTFTLSANANDYTVEHGLGEVPNFAVAFRLYYNTNNSEAGGTSSESEGYNMVTCGYHSGRHFANWYTNDLYRKFEDNASINDGTFGAYQATETTIKFNNVQRFNKSYVYGWIVGVI